MRTLSYSNFCLSKFPNLLSSSQGSVSLVSVPLDSLASLTRSGSVSAMVILHSTAHVVVYDFSVPSLQPISDGVGGICSVFVLDFSHFQQQQEEEGGAIEMVAQYTYQVRFVLSLIIYSTFSFSLD